MGWWLQVRFECTYTNANKPNTPIRLSSRCLVVIVLYLCLVAIYLCSHPTSQQVLLKRTVKLAKYNLEHVIFPL